MPECQCLTIVREGSAKTTPRIVPDVVRRLGIAIDLSVPKFAHVGCCCEESEQVVRKAWRAETLFDHDHREYSVARWSLTNIRRKAIAWDRKEGGVAATT